MNGAGSGTDPVEDSAEKQVALLFARLRSADIRALARAVSLVEDGGAEAAGLLALCRATVDQGTRTLRVGITGPPGAGKSTLVDALVREFRRKGRSVGIVAVDPSSPFTGGAILGDRIRMGEVTGDSGLFMRSMATRGYLGGLARTTDDVLTVIEASGKDVLLIETTGVGQGEIEVVRLADVVIVVLVPGMGDSVQSLKAGVLEIASIYVLNKADREGIDRLEQEIRGMLGFSMETSGRPVLRTVATTGQGVAELIAAVDGLAKTSRNSSGLHAELPAANKGRVDGAGLIPWLRARPNLEGSAPTAGQAGPILDHIGIAVHALAQAQELYLALGMTLGGVEEIPEERVRVAMLTMGESRIELIEAMGEDSVVWHFLAKRGEGLHHIALRVPDLSVAVEAMKERGVRLVSDQIKVGAGGHRYVFVHPSSANGVLVELVESAHLQDGRRN